tara:strand:+ start:7511 stop:8581 length:1071 start_codon:yes stop_codon:yes gene_type:complete
LKIQNEKFMRNSKLFKNKVLMITGGTGSFGNAVTRQFINSDLKEIRIFSRDEKKQDDMRKKFNNKKLKFYIGDVRNYRAVLNSMHDVDFLFHSAALKQVPSCEFHPMEAVKTNVQGTDNVLEAAINSNVKKAVCLSTDKAVYPINAMGISKALMEKVVVAKSRFSKSTTICCTRYGNVMGSRGSVIPVFVNQIRANKPVTITDPKMTRFMMTLEDAVNLVMYAFENGKNGDIFVQKAPASTINDLATAVSKIMKKNTKNIKILGTRHGEKIHETLLSREEMSIAKDLKKYYRVPIDGRDLNYNLYFSDGSQKITKSQDYNSSNTLQLDSKSLEKLLLKLPFMKDLSKGKDIEPILE